MFLMRPEHIQMSLTGNPCWKTETRRLWKKRRAKPNSIHQLREKLFGPSKGKVHVLLVWREHLLDITEGGAKREGGYTRESFLKRWFEINPKSPANPMLFVVRYEPATEAPP